MYETQLGKIDERREEALREWLVGQNAPRVSVMSSEDKSLELLRSIRNMLKFFVILTCIGLVVGIAAALRIVP